MAKAHGIDIEDGWIVCVPDNSYGLAHSAVCHMLESANAPDGVFACSDTYGAAVISAARRAGLTVPGDLMVVGFDNTDNAIMTTPTLTTVNQPRYRMGYTACNILLERMKGAAAPQSMTMETELVVRESRLIGQKVCLDRTHVLVQPEGVRVPVMELLPDGPVAPLRPSVLPFGRYRVGPV